MCSLIFGYKITNNHIIMLILEEVGYDRSSVCIYIYLVYISIYKTEASKTLTIFHVNTILKKKLF